MNPIIVNYYFICVKCPQKIVRQKSSKYRIFYIYKFDTRKKVPRKNGLRKHVLKKLFFDKKILGNLNEFFIFINWFHYTNKKMFDVHLKILHAPNCRTLNESRKVCCRVLGFHILITSQKSTHTLRCSTLTPRFFVSEFWVFIDWSPIRKLQVHKYHKIGSSKTTVFSR